MENGAERFAEIHPSTATAACPLVAASGRRPRAHGPDQPGVDRAPVPGVEGSAASPRSPPNYFDLKK
jgi:hypothetical protein